MGTDEDTGDRGEQQASAPEEFDSLKKIRPTRIRRRLWLFIAIATFASLAAGTACSQNGRPEGVYTYAVVNGVEFEISPGQIIAEGERLPNGSCRTPLVTVGSITKSGSNRVTIATTTTADCKVVVESISYERPLIDWPDLHRLFGQYVEAVPTVAPR